jgi:AraC-like DNA-binding protein
MSINARTAVPAPESEGCRLMLPRPSLSGCIFAAMERDTRHLNLAPADRVNYFPAIPHCSITIFLEGSAREATAWNGEEIIGTAPAPLPSIIFAGPRRGPAASVNPGPVHIFSAAITPQALCGLDMAACTDRILPASDILPRWLLNCCGQARQLGDGGAAFEHLQDTLEEPWRAVRPGGSPMLRFASDWSRHLLARAAASGAGHSLRQIERRVKTWTGLTQRDVAALVRAERVFASVMAGIGAEREGWAQLAVDSAYSDQPHLVREVRRMTGFTPEQLRRRVKTEPAFWCYRLLGELY